MRGALLLFFLLRSGDVLWEGRIGVLWKSVASSSKENTRNKPISVSSSVIVGTELLANCVEYFINLTIRTEKIHLSEIIGAKVYSLILIKCVTNFTGLTGGKIIKMCINIKLTLLLVQSMNTINSVYGEQQLLSFLEIARQRLMLAQTTLS